MEIREWLNANPSIAGGGAAVVLILGIVWMVSAMQGPGATEESGSAWYVDLQTGELFTAAASREPPIQSPGGNKAVRAHLYSCGSCQKGERFIGYYERVRPEARDGNTPPAATDYQFFSGKAEGGSYDRPPLSDSRLQALRNDEGWTGYSMDGSGDARAIQEVTDCPEGKSGQAKECEP